MKSANLCRRFLGPLSAIGAAVAACATAAQAVTPSGTTRYWLCGNGQWQSLSCWGGQLPPAAGDSVALVVGTATIHFGGTNSSQLNQLNLQGFNVIFNQSGDTVLTSNAEFLDSTGSTQSFSRHVQGSGLNQTGWLSVGATGAGVSTYTATGTARLDVAGSLELGARNGSGVGGGSFLQSGGTQVSADRLALTATGWNLPSYYILEAGTLTSGRTDLGVATQPGEAGTASFVQTGGVHTTGTLYTAQTGTYSLRAGRLNLTNYEAAGGGLGGIFDWQAGTVHVNRALDIGDGSMPFNQGKVVSVGAGRTLSADTLRVPEGQTLAHAGGKVVVESTHGFINSGAHAIDSGTFTVNGTATSTGLTTLAGGAMDGSNGSDTNQGVFTGYGRLQGDVTVVNEGLWTVGGGRLQVAGARPLSNKGTLSFAGVTDSLDLSFTGGGVLPEARLLNQGLLQLSGQQITGEGLLVNATDGTLGGWGTVRTPFANQGSVVVTANGLTFTRSFANLGVVELTSPLSRLAGAGVVNDGTVQGLGTVAAPFSNQPGGTVEARAGTLVLSSYLFRNDGVLAAASGAKLQLPGGLGNNDGQIVLAGGTLAVTGPLTSTGSISGYGSLQLGSIVNTGRMQFTGGTLLLSASGGLHNGAGGQIIASGNANVSLFGAVHLAAGSELRVSEGAVATFFGAVQAEPGVLFTGTGVKHYEGGLAIGSSPGLGIDAGDVHFGGANVYTAEMAGLAPGTGFDKYIVAGRLNFGGTLKLVEFTGFQPQAGDRFDLFDWGSSSGSFGAIDTRAATLGPGLAWDFSQLYVNGEIGVTAVPEPAVWALCLAGLVGLAQRTRRVQGPARSH